ncbi:hypothetical protein MMC13_006628 [Lambiella insularis]|nr:hypothetical protein [Lambiella insularis]
MDEDTAEVVLTLQLQDLDALIDDADGPTTAPNPSDGSAALITYRDEIAAKLTALRDARMSKSIAKAVEQDSEAIRSARATENIAISDRQNAFGVIGLGAPDLPPPFNDLADGIDDVIMSDLATYNTIAPLTFDLTTTTQVEHGQHFHQTRAPLDEGDAPEDNEDVIGVKKTCCCCDEQVAYFSAVYAPCGHDYCSVCIQQIFKKSLKTEQPFPPRCCRITIPLAAASVFFDKAFTATFNAKLIETNTMDPTYCAGMAGGRARYIAPTTAICNTFIPPSEIVDNVGTCPKRHCRQKTCTICKKPAHTTGECPQDPAMRSFIAVAQVEGWQRCYMCNRYVGLSQGCNHVTCRCGTQFCYVCAQPWGETGCPNHCPLWEVTQQERPNQLANQQLEPQADQHMEGVAGPAGQEEVNQVPDQGGVVECDHPEWQKTKMRTKTRTKREIVNLCENCSMDCKKTMMICGLCGVRICRQCCREMQAANQQLGPQADAMEGIEEPAGQEAVDEVQDQGGVVECSHPGWMKKKAKKKKCEHCNRACDRFVMVCGWCGIQTCLKCRVHRL